jgi:hypothetical protein
MHVASKEPHMASEPIELPLVPTFRWNASSPMFLQLVVAGVIVVLAWMALAAVFTDRRGRILSGWTLNVTQTDATLSGDVPEEAVQATQNQVTQALSSFKLPATATASFGKLALNLEFPATLSPGDSVKATRRVCIDPGERLAFYISTPYKRTQVSGAFVLHLRQDGRELWSLRLPAAQQPLVYAIPLSGGRCSQMEFELTSNVAMKAESWRRASRVEIIFPRLDPAR